MARMAMTKTQDDGGGKRQKTSAGPACSVYQLTRPRFQEREWHVSGQTNPALSSACRFHPSAIRPSTRTSIKIGRIAGRFEAFPVLEGLVRGQGCQPVVLRGRRIQAEEETGGAAASQASPRVNLKVRM